MNVLHELALDEVLLVVANEPWQKTGERRVSSAEHRLAMVEAAVHDVPGLSASDIEITRGGPSYTIDTVDELESDGSTKAYVILGSDAAASITTWEQAEDLRTRARIVVVDRPGSAGLRPPAGWDWINVEAPRLEVSSTDLRDRLVDGRPLDFLIPKIVRDVILDEGVYPVDRDGEQAVGHEV